MARGGGFKPHPHIKISQERQVEQWGCAALVGGAGVGAEGVSGGGSCSRSRGGREQDGSKASPYGRRIPPVRAAATLEMAGGGVGVL